MRALLLLSLPFLAMSSEVFFNFDLLVWDAREEGLEYAYRNTSTQNHQHLTSFEPHSKFDPGFRMTFGGHLPYDHWDLKGVYTFYHTTRHASSRDSFDPTAAPGPGMIATWTYPSAFSNNNIGARFQVAQSLWQLHASFFDLALSRPSPLSSFFTITPFFAIRSAWLHQYNKMSYGDGNLVQVNVLSSAVNMHSSSQNIGPAFGCSFQWLLGKHVDLFSHLSGALVASSFHVKRKETDLFLQPSGELSTESLYLTNKYWAFRSQGQLTLGISFCDLCRYRQKDLLYHISFAYETQMWWKQNQSLRYLDSLNATSSGANVIPTQGDLMFHGLDVEIGIDF